MTEYCRCFLQPRQHVEVAGLAEDAFAAVEVDSMAVEAEDIAVAVHIAGRKVAEAEDIAVARMVAVVAAVAPMD